MVPYERGNSTRTVNWHWARRARSKWQRGNSLPVKSETETETETEMSVSYFGFGFDFGQGLKSCGRRPLCRRPVAILDRDCLFQCLFTVLVELPRS